MHPKLLLDDEETLDSSKGPHGLSWSVLGIVFGSSEVRRDRPQNGGIVQAHEFDDYTSFSTIIKIWDLKFYEQWYILLKSTLDFSG